MKGWLVRILLAIGATVIGLSAIHLPGPSPLPSLPSCLDSQLQETASTQSVSTYGAASLTRLTGPGTSSEEYQAQGDLLIPYLHPNCSTGLILGDTFTGDVPGQGTKRSPVILQTDTTPVPGQPLRFSGAAGISGPGYAPSVMDEKDIIPTDGISFPETGDEIISYMKIHKWDPSPDQQWTTNYAGLAWSSDGGKHFIRVPHATWLDTPSQDAFQVMSMQREGDFVYIVSVRPGRLTAADNPMMLQRVPWNSMLDPSTYQCWKGSDWTTDYNQCQPILTGSFGEPSLRLLSDHTWVLSYLNTSDPGHPRIVTRWSMSLTSGWSSEKTQLDWNDYPYPFYGGFIHPLSTRDNLMLMVSTWVPDKRYDVSLLRGSL